MTGLHPDRDVILEIGVLVTDANLQIVAEGPDLIIHQSEATLAGMDDWNQRHHRASGLLERVRASVVSVAQAEQELLAFVNQHFGQNVRPILTGNSIHQDRRFIHRFLPVLDARLHYRMIDVSSVKELARRWYPDDFAGLPAKSDKHRALDDIRESVAELAAYRRTIFR